jgi:F-type H+-transporting ATPase subunit b
MNIDWFTLFAQIVNFLILLVLLKYLLYDRIIGVMDQRQDKIRESLDEAERKQEKAEKELQEYRQKQQDLEEEKKNILDKQREEAEKQKEEILKESGKEADRLRDQYVRKVKQDKEDFLKTLRRETGKQIFTISRKVLQDLAQKELEEQMIDTFLEQLSKMDAEKRGELENVMQNNQQKIQVRTSFKMSGDQKEKVRKALKKVLAGNAEWEFEQSSDIQTGLELRIGDQKISWSIDGYLNELEEEFAEKLEKQMMQRAKAREENQADGKEENQDDGQNRKEKNDG